MDMLEEVVTQFGTTLVTITHDLSVAARADRQFRLDQGVLSALTAAELPSVTARRTVA
jgi:putative ABC transport system ATP-binding protein